ncbi:RagB/SusD family nutrient uptake outer membrane protein [Paraflavisolibacter sp. H34]|uniref:RagB/SusD family nutrient uptake outer membrane protein n=1 Tax=Huijunlia imazamoxiresistens TaxID=3127457 RepID=UPI00301799E0
MKRIFFATILSFAVAGVFSSCQKFLDRKPINQATDQNFWTTEGEANNSIAGTYALVRTALNEMGFAHYYYGDFATDEFVVPAAGEDYQQLNRMEWNYFVAPTELHRAMIRLRRWDNFYRAIDQANRCLKYIPEVPVDKFTSANKAEARDALLGEAYFLRAFTYFYMARVWGDVPLVTESVEDAAKAEQLPRRPQAEVLNLVIRDLEAAIAKMTWKPGATSSRAIRVSRGAAYALLAHVQAWKGDYAKVIPAADSVIAKGGYSYANRSTGTGYLGIFKGNSSEGIFEIAQNANNEGAGGSTAYGTIINNVAFRTLKAPYLVGQNNNVHFPLDRVTLGGFFPENADSNDYRRKNGFAFWGTSDPITIKYSNIVYTGPNNTSPISLNNMIIFRLPDIKLLKAEALAATGAFGEARTILDEIRALNNVSASAAADNNLFEAIIDERGRELFLEGHRFYDLVRLGRKTGILKFNGSTGINRMDDAQFQAGKYYWPIDPILIQVNPGLAQTPFWSDKM